MQVVLGGFHAPSSDSKLLRVTLRSLIGVNELSLHIIASEFDSYWMSRNCAKLS